MSVTASAPPASRRTITTVTSYEAAEQAVDFLSDQQFPVAHVTIVGSGLRYVEQVSRRVTTGNGALRGAGSGGVLGLLWGLAVGVFFTGSSGSFFGVLGYSLVIGVVFGAAWGAIAQGASGGRRAFNSVAEPPADPPAVP